MPKSGFFSFTSLMAATSSSAVGWYCAAAAASSAMLPVLLRSETKLAPPARPESGMPFRAASAVRCAALAFPQARGRLFVGAVT